MHIAEKHAKKYSIVGLDGGLFKTFQSVYAVAPFNINVLLSGETGTGKELFAELIHNLSPFSTGNLVKINCAALPENLLESELFGYQKGAFTGAEKNKQGKIEMAHNGTLFLDEIGEMKPDLQVKLLRVLQTKEFSRIGSLNSLKINFRLIAATNLNLQQAVKNSYFREDLFYRLSSFPIEIPPLRERKSDITALTVFLCQKICDKTKLKSPVFASAALQELVEYSWPGNVRELENTIFQALIYSQNQQSITAELIGNLLKNRKEQNYTQAIDKIIHIIISKKLDLKQINQDLVNALLNHFNNNVSLIEQNTGISKDRIYRYKKRSYTPFISDIMHLPSLKKKNFQKSVADEGWNTLYFQ